MVQTTDTDIECKLQQLERTQREFWNIDSEVGALFNMLLRTGQYRNALELGTSNGYSTIWLARALRANRGHLVTIEYFNHRQEMARKNITDCGLLEWVTFLKGRAVDVVSTLHPAIYNLSSDFSYDDLPKYTYQKVPDHLKEPFLDFVFIDASKVEYLQYFELIDPRLKRGGMIVADNVISHEGLLSDFINVISTDINYSTVKLLLGGGVLIAFKNLF